MVEHPLTTLGSTVRDFLDTVEAAGAQADWQLLPEGPAGADWATDQLAGQWGDLPVRDAYRTGAILWPVIHDQTLALADLLAPPARPFGVLTTARGLAEAAARSWLLLEPGLDHEERVRRYLNDRLYAMAQERWMLRDYPGADLGWALDRRDQIHAEGTARGWAVIPEVWQPPKHLRASSFRPGRLGNQAALAATIGRPALAALFYTSTSAVAHASLHGVVKLYEFSDPDPDKEQRIRAAPLTASAAAMHVTPAVNAMCAVGEALAWQAGWPGAKDVHDQRARVNEILQALLDLA